MSGARLAWLLALAAACGAGGGGPADALTNAPDGALPDGALPDGALPDGALPDGAVPDGAVPDGAVPDSVDASFDGGGEGCLCPAFERCAVSGCECGDDRVLCGTRGYASFPLVEPSARALRVDGDVVVDELTGLVWMRRSEGARPWPEARAYCETLSLGGRDDWRLPARVELASILDASRTPSFDPGSFEGAADYVWTSSRPANSRIAAFAIYFGQGETVSAGTAVGGGHVRCVAGAREPAPLGVAREDVVQHGGLLWERASAPAMTHEEAVARCAFTGARLPTLYELHDLVDEARRAPAIDPALFPDTPSARFWSATERDFGEILAWAIDFTEGQSVLLERGELAHPRCVRRP